MDSTCPAGACRRNGSAIARPGSRGRISSPTGPANSGRSRGLERSRARRGLRAGRNSVPLGRSQARGGARLTTSARTASSPSSDRGCGFAMRADRRRRCERRGVPAQLVVQCRRIPAGPGCGDRPIASITELPRVNMPRRARMGWCLRKAAARRQRRGLLATEEWLLSDVRVKTPG